MTLVTENSKRMQLDFAIYGLSGITGMFFKKIKQITILINLISVSGLYLFLLSYFCFSKLLTYKKRNVDVT